MPQNVVIGGGTGLVPMLARTAETPNHSPSGMWVTICMAWRCTSSATAFLSASVVACANLSRSFSMASSLGQPPRAFSPVAMRLGVIKGSRMSSCTQLVPKAFQPPSDRRALLRREPGHHALPVHRLDIDLEAGPLELGLGDRRELLDHAEIGRLRDHHHGAVVARFLQKLTRLGDIAFDQSVHGGGRLQRRTAGKHRLTGAIETLVADIGLQEFLLAQRVGDGLADLLVVERRLQPIHAEHVLVWRATGDDADILVLL